MPGPLPRLLWQCCVPEVEVALCLFFCVLFLGMDVEFVRLAHGVVFSCIAFMVIAI